MTRAVQLQDVRVVAAGRVLLDVPRLGIGAGERVAIVGPNGAGKSTLLKVIGGALPASQGQVQVLGREIGPYARPPLTRRQRRAFHAQLGLLMQGLHLVSRLTARENVAAGALASLHGTDRWRSLLRWYPPAVRADVDAALAAMGLADRADARADRLSGGERQKVALARLQLQRPQLVLADEPTSALDPAATALVCDALRALAGEAGRTLVTVLHDLTLLPRLADRVIGMARGRVAWDLAPADIRPSQWADLYDAAEGVPAHRPAPPARRPEPGGRMTQTPGRSCPLHYRYDPSVFACEAPPALQALDVLYVVGGLYGNVLALARVLDLFDRERGRKRLVFNGDFHWFDADPEVFAVVQRGVLAHEALRGNVETELAADGDDAGCGCAYPDWVGDGVVERSNRILQRLRQAATATQRSALAALPMWRRADVGGARVGIVHGDATSLAGWGFAQEHLQEPRHRAEVGRWFERAQVDVFACTHTCLPVFQALQGRRRWVLNNGAAGMPNFRGDPAGLLTRIALQPYAGPHRRFGVTLASGVHADAIAIDVDGAEWHRRFLVQWPEGSDANVSYGDRIRRGPDYLPGLAIRTED